MRTLNGMGKDERLTLAELSALSPNERADLARAGVVRDWDQLDPAEQAHIQAKTADLRRRRVEGQRRLDAPNVDDGRDARPLGASE